MFRILFACFSIIALVLLCGGALLPAPIANADDINTGKVKQTEMALIPGGEFMMGGDVEDDHQPVHEVHVDSFYMDIHEVTNAQYLEFCTETERKLPIFWEMDEFRCGPKFPHHPVVGVCWSDAKAYAEWAGKRLPTEAEWEYAARGGLAGKKYPNGDTIDTTLANYYVSEGAEPVRSYPANGFGLYDMAGNVNEWVFDFYFEGYYDSSPHDNPTGPEKGKFHVIRGGGWHSGPYCNRVYRRCALIAYWIDFNVGFRCAKDLR